MTVQGLIDELEKMPKDRPVSLVVHSPGNLRQGAGGALKTIREPKPQDPSSYPVVLFAEASVVRG